MIVRFVFTLLIFALLGVCSGCQKGTLLIGAVVCQGWDGPSQQKQGDLWTFNGLNPGTAPRIRPGSYATATHGVHFLDPNELGPHSYRLNWSERNGIVYTCRAGHIDIAHVRKAVDWTGYLAARSLEAIHRGDTEFQFKLREPSLYCVQLTYPENWSQLAEADRVHIAREVSCAVGQYLGYTAMTWHEILTWFGFRPKGYKSEFPSAFSWEDTYSNLLGTHIAVRAIESDERDFSEAVTGILDEVLDRLNVRSAEQAYETTVALRERWYTDHGLFTRISRRHFDLGLTDGYVSPCLTPNSTTCSDRRTLPLAVPTLNCLAQYGFSVKLEIKPRVWEKKRILRTVYSSGSILGRSIEPVIHFPQIMDYIVAEAVERYGHDIGPGNRSTANALGSIEGI